MGRGSRFPILRSGGGGGRGAAKNYQGGGAPTNTPYANVWQHLACGGPIYIYFIVHNFQSPSLE
jgi:hypothetical protein